MSEYQKEQFDAYEMVIKHLALLPETTILELKRQVEPYLAFRTLVNRFFEAHLGDICNRNCYESRKSACCSKEGIVTFFADVVINALLSDADDIKHLLMLLKTENTGFKCIYLGKNGCRWKLKPIVCEMFLCQKAKSEAFERAPGLTEEWDRLKKKEKLFTWPDKPVLFDDIEEMFLRAGLDSPLMYLHNSPGLLRVKKMSIKRRSTPSDI